MVSSKWGENSKFSEKGGIPSNTGRIRGKQGKGERRLKTSPKEGKKGHCTEKREVAFLAGNNLETKGYRKKNEE